MKKLLEFRIWGRIPFSGALTQSLLVQRVLYAIRSDAKTAEDIAQQINADPCYAMDTLTTLKDIYLVQHGVREGTWKARIEEFCDLDPPAIVEHGGQLSLNLPVLSRDDLARLLSEGDRLAEIIHNRVTMPYLEERKKASEELRLTALLLGGLDALPGAVRRAGAVRHSLPVGADVGSLLARLALWLYDRRIGLDGRRIGLGCGRIGLGCGRIWLGSRRVSLGAGCIV